MNYTMNEELQQALTQFLTASLNAVEKGATIAGEQIPLILQEIVQWKIWSSAVGFVGFLLLSIVLAIVALKCWKQINPGTDEFCVPIGACAVLCLLIAPVMFLISCEQLYRLIKVLTAPRLVLIEFLKGII